MSKLKRRDMDEQQQIKGTRPRALQLQLVADPEWIRSSSSRWSAGRADSDTESAESACRRGELECARRGESAVQLRAADLDGECEPQKDESRAALRSSVGLRAAARMRKEKLSEEEKRKQREGEVQEGWSRAPLAIAGGRVKGYGRRRPMDELPVAPRRRGRNRPMRRAAKKKIQEAGGRSGARRRMREGRRAAAADQIKEPLAACCHRQRSADRKDHHVESES